MVRHVERTIAGRYALRAQLGAGGMGEVFAADDLRLHREVAVKLVPASAINPVARARFVREARSAARISHPNAVVVYDAGEADGYLYLVMERLVGQALDQRLASTGPMRVSEAASVAIAVLGALGAAHAAGVVHRDVKPANIVVGPTGVKLVDFGVATLLDDIGSSVTAAGELVGTPKYLDPEQIAGNPATPASDLYAVGVVLFEMLAGTAPFDRGSPVATAIAHPDDEPPDLRSIRPDVPPRVAAVVATALRKRPGDRYQSAAEMQRALGPAIADDYAGETAVIGAPVSGAAPTSASRAGWWVAAAALAIGGTTAAMVVAGNDDDDRGTRPTPPVTATAAPTPDSTTTTSPATTTAEPTTTLAPTTTAIARTPTSAEGLIAVFAAAPARYGTRTEEVITRLGEIDNRGRQSRDRAAGLLGSAAEWVDGGELTPEAFALLETVLAPLADQGNGADDDDEDDD
jgi:serine/threonine-protein kinase